MTIELTEEGFERVTQAYNEVKKEIQHVIVGQDEVIHQTLWAIIAQGHALLEGMPGVGKTMLIRTISDVMSLSFQRIQFTPDLMPSDITGTMMVQNLNGKQSFQFHQGPLFANIVLADEINRATPKTQSALLEAMAEKTVTTFGEMRMLPNPFFVLATQNPIDLEGTYSLPEAQMDRFLLKINVPSPTKEELIDIVKKTTSSNKMEPAKVIDVKGILQMQEFAEQIIVSDDLIELAVKLILSTQPDSQYARVMVKEYVRFGAGPRGLQSLIKIAKARALSLGRYHVSLGDLKKAALPVLRHRIHLNFEAEAKNIQTDEVILEVINELSAGNEI